MKYKVGDKVRIKSKNEGKPFFCGGMEQMRGKVVEISRVYSKRYDIKRDGGFYTWTDDMFEIKEDGGIYAWTDDMFEPVMTNFDKVKEEIKIDEADNNAVCKAIHRVRKEASCINIDCDECKKWLKQPYEKPKKEILDKEEKEYLSAVIKPFRDRIKFISKVQRFANKRLFYLETELKGDDFFSLPDFVEDTMYKGVELGRKYTLEELGL